MNPNVSIQAQISCFKKKQFNLNKIKYTSALISLFIIILQKKSKTILTNIQVILCVK